MLLYDARLNRIYMKIFGRCHKQGNIENDPSNIVENKNKDTNVQEMKCNNSDEIPGEQPAMYIRCHTMSRQTPTPSDGVKTQQTPSLGKFTI